MGCSTLDSEQAVRRTFDAWADAYVRRDMVALEAIIADDWMYAGAPSGTTTSKEQALAEFRSRESRYEDFDFQDLRGRFYGNAAIVTGRETIRLRRDADTSSEQLRFTDVFVKQDGRWQPVSLERLAAPAMQTG